MNDFEQKGRTQPREETTGVPENPETPTETRTTRSGVRKQVVEALTPAGEADEYRGLTLHRENRDEEALPHLEAAAKEGRPVARFFAALIKRPENLEDFLKNIEDLFASFLEIAHASHQIDQHLPLVLKKLRDIPPRIDIDTHTSTSPSEAQPQEPITIQALLENMTIFLKNQGNQAQQIQAIKTITTLLETLTTPRS